MYEPPACRLCGTATRSLLLRSAARHSRSQFTRYLGTSSESNANQDGGSPAPHAPDRPRPSAAAHMLAQARIEEADMSPFRNISSRALEQQRSEVAWQGEESIEDSVLRLLVDKYKPLRVPGMKREVQQPSSEPIIFPPSAPPAERVYKSDGQVDQTIVGYQWQEGDPPRFPWEHTFQGPTIMKEGEASVRTGVMTRSSASASVTSMTRVSANTTHNRSARPTAGDVAARVYRARDASVDYASGSHDTAKAKVAPNNKTAAARAKLSGQQAGSYRPLPTSVRGWTNVIEDRIELARQQGLFKNIKGRGKPFVKDVNEDNPFLDRTEFLMNRIVKRQEAAPPFVELQKEVRDEANVFRARLREAWIRRATRMICLQPLTRTVIDRCGEYRDSEWEGRERSYWEISIKAINELIRKHNIVAPPSVRMPFLTVSLELAGAYRDSATIIKEELERRSKAGLGPKYVAKQRDEAEEIVGKVAETEEAAVKESMLSAMRRFVRDIVKERQERKKQKVDGEAAASTYERS